MAVGALLGLILGTAAVAATGLAFNTYAFVGALIAGVLAGTVMRAVVGPGGAVYAKGALAAMATAAATILGPFVQTQWFRAQSNVTMQAPTNVVREADAASVEKPAGDGDAAVTEVLDDRSAPFGSGPLGGPLRAPNRDPFALADVACLVIGCLAAYQIGKSEGPVTGEGEAEDDAPHNEPSPLPPVD
jgi:hypothetical protein